MTLDQGAAANGSQVIRPYGSTAHLYWAAGHPNPIPISDGYGDDGKFRPLGKTTPPKGFTGYTGGVVKPSDLEKWLKGPQSGHNIGLRLSGMVGIDVDAYGGKWGDVTLEFATEKLGALPPTYSSTSRGQGQESRIHFYRLPHSHGVNPRLDEDKFRKEFGQLRTDENGEEHIESDVEFIHWGWRYAVVHPSIHPKTGQRYEWFGLDGELLDHIPSPQDFPELPEAWVNYLVKTEEAPTAESARGEGDPFVNPSTHPPKTLESAKKLLNEKVAAFEAMTEPDKHRRTQRLNDLALLAGHGVPNEFWKAEDATSRLLAAATKNGYVAKHGAETAKTQINNGIRDGQKDPWERATRGRPRKEKPAKTERPDAQPGDLEIGNPGEMTYWLRDNLGQGRLAGFFIRHSEVVYTAAEGEDGYVELRGKGSDGPAEIRPADGGAVAARVQFAFNCFKWEEETDEDLQTEWKQVQALFPLKSAQYAVAAPDAMGHLRPLRGVTHTPLLRADGSVLGVPGYDGATGYLYLPGDGVDVPEVPERPTAEQVRAAVELLNRMTADFPWGGEDDRANYYGLLLTPLLRNVAPPSYKMFGINAHQPGSGKTLLASVAGIIHERVMRSEMPENEAELRKQASAILSTTSAPIVHIDNVTGTVGSPTLAGLLTAGPDPITDRELGASRNLTMVNDRVWVLTGNNISLGGDLVRRTVLISIDPNMPNPETRTEFAIEEPLEEWVRKNRNEILAALLTLVRAWVAEGMPEPKRKQSDGFARWSRVVAGILQVAGVPGTFDNRSGEKAAAGGDDDGLAKFLDEARRRYGDRTWTAADILTSVDSTVARNPNDPFTTIFNPEALPDPVAEKVAKAGVKFAGRTFGRWLSYRVGRWVAGAEGHVVLRKVGETRSGSGEWRVELRG